MQNKMDKAYTCEGGLIDPDQALPGYEEPLESGPVIELPWVNDDDFMIAQVDNDAYILMAAYRTVLKDPLPGEEYNVQLAAKKLSGTIIKPGELFSQNRCLGPYTQKKGYRKGPTYFGSRLATTVGGGVCKISSTLYNVAILCNLQVVERHFHSMPVPYVPYGQDATVAYGVKDFRFKNITNSPILIWAKGIDNILYIAFYGTNKPPKVEWRHEIIKTFEAPRIYRVNPELGDGEEKIILEGLNGAIVKSWLLIENCDGTVSIKHIGNSYYSPMPYIIEKNK